uniref:Putative conserved plasma membrane protein n=1 Tax=Corethrella appendiculata TaxID=1370023 RepID=U5EFN3_9DIPT
MKFENIVLLVVLIYLVNSIKTQQHQHDAILSSNIKKFSQHQQHNDRRILLSTNSSRIIKDDDDKRILKNSLDDNYYKTRHEISRRSNRNSQQHSTTNICFDECECNNGEHIAVECNFFKNKEYILNGKLTIPQTASSLTIKLEKQTSLIIDKGIFNGNQINRLTIQCYTTFGNEQIEIRRNALEGNSAPLPEIEIFNCRTVIIREKAFHGEIKFNVTNCQEVNIYPSAFENCNLLANFNHINDLRMQEKVFKDSVSATVNIININNSRIEFIRNLGASMKMFKVENSLIDWITSNAFNMIAIQVLKFEKCRINMIESDAMPEKLYCNYFEMSECEIGTISTNFINGNGFDNFYFRNNRIEIFEKNAMKFTAINLKFNLNRIVNAKENWLHITNWNSIEIENNKFGNFSKLTVDKAANPLKCIFKNITIRNPDVNSLNFGNDFCRIREISLHQQCECGHKWLARITKTKLDNEIYCNINDTLKRCLQTDVIRANVFNEKVCHNNSKIFDCLNMNVEKKQASFISENEIQATENKFNLIYIIAISCAGLIFISIFVLVIRKICLKSSSEHTNIPNDVTSISPYATTTSAKLYNNKTFSKEDKLIIKQTMEKLKEKQTKENYDQVFNNTRKLLDFNLTETEKVLSIGEIVRVLGECENCGDDFVAFTDILYRHLAPGGNAENNIANPEDEYAEPSILLQQTQKPQPNTNIPDPELQLDHIYAELNCAQQQQPLLVSDYSTPMDKSEGVNLYSEPIQISHNTEAARSLITPYAIANTTTISPTTKQMPSTSKNLPDILPSSSAATAALERIKKSPKSQRDIPEYTMPIKSRNLPHRHQIEQDNHSDTSSSSSSNNNSEHSGGSDVTMKIDDVEYADA